MLLVITTFPDTETARQVGTSLVQKQLAACVNITPQIESIFQWEGALRCEPEVLAFIKTSEEAYPELEKTLGELHPYDVPEIIAVAIDRGSAPYLKWVAESTGSR